ncbi:MAG TPA: VTT domain-containing protein [Gemmatimonadaceae bacterium]|nr:VTT domain-containing protein [Gemmatimonadaceae bacterium]
MTEPAPSTPRAENAAVARKPRGVRGWVLRIYSRIYRWAESGWARTATGTYGLVQGSVMPGPSDALFLPLSVADPKRAPTFAAWSVAGLTVGSLIAYCIGVFAFDQVGVTIIGWLGFSPEQLERVRVLFAEKGWVVIVLGSLPMASPKLTAIAAGAFGYPLPVFIVIVFIVRAVRFFAVAFLIRYAGERMTAWIERKLGRPLTAAT